MKTAVIVMGFLAFANSQNPNPCPDDENIRPCTCRIGKDTKPWITCDSIKSSDVLVKAVKGMEGLSVSNFHLDNCNIGVLPADVFMNMNIQTLNIINTNLTKLSESRNRPPFLGLEDSLELLEMKNAFVDANSPLSLLSLSHLKKLASIHLDNNRVPTIGNNWFESGPYGLRDLYFYNTSTSTIGSHAFEALENLRSFKLSAGLFSEVSRDMFPLPAVFLEKIDLSMNKLKDLPNNLFSKMPSLEELSLENNLLTTINEIVFAPVWSQLVTVNFFGNPIICDANMKWIYKYRTPENFRGRCAGPPRLLNKDFTNLRLSDLE